MLIDKNIISCTTKKSNIVKYITRQTNKFKTKLYDLLYKFLEKTKVSYF